MSLFSYSASRLDHLTDSLLHYVVGSRPPLRSGSPTTHEFKELLLLENVQRLLDRVCDTHNENLTLLERVEALLDRLSSAQAQLHQTLDQVVRDLPPHRHHLSTAQSQHIAAVIESSLVRISLLRARAHRSLYGLSQSQHGNDRTILSALGVAYRKLKADEARAREEERALDEGLAEYHNLLAVVDGNDGGGFQQISKDWAKVRKETEECRKDLRRLGWTGD